MARRSQNVLQCIRVNARFLLHDDRVANATSHCNSTQDGSYSCSSTGAPGLLQQHPAVVQLSHASPYKWQDESLARSRSTYSRKHACNIPDACQPISIRSAGSITCSPTIPDGVGPFSISTAVYQYPCSATSPAFHLCLTFAHRDDPAYAANFGILVRHRRHDALLSAGWRRELRRTSVWRRVPGRWSY